MSAWKWVEAGVLAALVHQVLRAVSGVFLLAPLYFSRGQLWRVPGDRSAALFPAVYLFVGLVLAYVYCRVRTVVGGEGLRKGLRFGFWVWVIASVPAQAVRFALMPVPGALAVGESLVDLAAYLISGLLFVRLLEPRSPVPSTPSDRS